MKAAIIENYGDSNQFIIKEIAKPEIGANEVLIKIQACSVNPIDWRIRSGSLKYVYPIRFPAILGFDLAGTVEAVGKEARLFNIGDTVYSCSVKKEGQAYAQYIALDENTVSFMPKTMDFKQAATVPLTAMTALQALRDKGRVQANDKVLIIGASGGVGMFAVQIAKILGASVTAVCSTENIEFVKKLGADEVIDYKKTSPFSAEQQYDVIFDCVAAHHYSKAKSKLTGKGIYISTIPDASLIIQSIISRFTAKKAKFILLNKSKEDLDEISRLIDNQQLYTYIDSEYHLSDIALAHQRSESHHARGKIVVLPD
ncbi:MULTISPECIES: NAD(P)-dependent alcohol dehydrogenase [unclassified Legionella]|uniref:NAD(P)-dependent alcohol dehydrogenase n=1 Tax=unclassified Legionella TaxID=2622702 RepID=UPI0010555FAD|nr:MULTISPECIES: NAD(P)-dependent alcohol dehydrogenase [unclassified Legionella]MDI9819074.1 NAD(P)-dependent alcohol dehydrogenase [Legionella sp. PL877]